MAHGNERNQRERKMDKARRAEKEDLTFSSIEYRCSYNVLLYPRGAMLICYFSVTLRTDILQMSKQKKKTSLKHFKEKKNMEDWVIV